ncbi:MAG TPA: YjbE family putative metal transport protein [Magnetospirillum sp.]|jgi:YjbE family integral membrane protein|nr:YjbE family putative metal transport protein [Magnetospirillum sp.]
MDLFGDVSFIGTPLKIFLVDLLLSGDNAVVIALACRSLPPRHARNAAILGTVVAILLRLLLTSVAAAVLQVPYLKLLGAIALVVIAVKLILAEEDDAGAKVAARDDLFSAIGVIVVADAVMSIDNVVAVAAAAQGDIGYLLLGLGLSIPLLVFGSLIIARMLNRYPVLISGGGAVLGWMAGDIAVSDPAIAEWIGSQSFGLAALAPALGALFVLLHARIIERERQQEGVALVPAGGALLHELAEAMPFSAGPEPAPVPVVELEPAAVAAPQADPQPEEAESSEAAAADTAERGRGIADSVLLVGMIGVPIAFVATLLWGIIHIVSAARQL